jgi:hypothetical protein
LLAARRREHNQAVKRLEWCLGVAAASLVCGALGCDSKDPYPSYQACFDDRVNVSQLQITEAIVACCDDEITGMPAPVCGTTTAECTSYLATNLTEGATSGDKSAGCTQYFAR